MNAIALLVGIGCIGAAVLILRMAKQDLVNKRIIETLEMTPVGNLKPGLNLTSGEVVYKNPIKTPYTGTPAAWYKYTATKRMKSSSSPKMEERSIGSGSLYCPFLIKDNTGEVEVVGNGGEVPSYPHSRVLKSQSGISVSLKERMAKLKEIDRANQPEDGKKSFFRKIDGGEGIPLDVPPDLIEIDRNTEEAEKTEKKYYESWIQEGDKVYVLGTLVKDDASGTSKIMKPGKKSPLFVCINKEDLDQARFKSNFITGLLFGIGIALLGVILLVIGFGVVEV
jgi:hypothetical protein